MKKIFCIALALMLCAVCFYGCNGSGNDEFTIEEAVTAEANSVTENKQYTFETLGDVINESSTSATSTAPSAENTDGTGTATTVPVASAAPETSAKSYGSIDFDIAESFTAGGNVVSVTDINITDRGIGDYVGKATVTFSEFNKDAGIIHIKYKAFDAEGNVTNNTYIRIDLTKEGLGVGSSVDCRFNINRNAVKVVFAAV